MSREAYIRATRAAGYNYFPSGDAAGGVWNETMRGAEDTRRRTADATAAANAEAAMTTAVNAILTNGSLTNAQKYAQLARLNYTGYSRREFTILRDAKASVS